MFVAVHGTLSHSHHYALCHVLIACCNLAPILIMTWTKFCIPISPTRSPFFSLWPTIFAPSHALLTTSSLVKGKQWACFKRKLKNGIKVKSFYPPAQSLYSIIPWLAQLVGYISEHTAYNHGEQSLKMTIVDLRRTILGATTWICCCPMDNMVCVTRVERRPCLSALLLYGTDPNHTHHLPP